jgi:hypothetical protein
MPRQSTGHRLPRGFRTAFHELEAHFESTRIDAVRLKLDREDIAADQRPVKIGMAMHDRQGHLKNCRR